MNRLTQISAILFGLLVLVAIIVYRTLPIERVGIRSQLIMLGDLNNDNKWNQTDAEILANVLSDPFRWDRFTLANVDVNRNGLLDAEDTLFLNRLYHISDPYLVEQQARERHEAFPRPRELFQYRSEFEYVQPPVVVVPNDLSRQSPFEFIQQWSTVGRESVYEGELLAEVYSEAMRFTSAYRMRESGLSSIERNYADDHIKYCDRLYAEKEYYLLLLSLVGLVEDAETLRYSDQPEFIQKILYFRDDLRDLLTSSAFGTFEKNEINCDSVLRLIETGMRSILGVGMKMDTLPPPRNLLKLDNYVDRLEWQKNKSKSLKDDFLKLILFAQNDRRYLRAVSMTSRKHNDLILENHNLPMILLFREALQITSGDKKAAVGLLDEALRIPFSWIKSIPRNILPSSVALENFLLPGNMEDGSDKSRHWNVFGGIALYRSPQEALVVAFEREVSDVKHVKQTPEALREFIRDVIADINGIYYVMSINDRLLPGVTTLGKP